MSRPDPDSRSEESERDDRRRSSSGRWMAVTAHLVGRALLNPRLALDLMRLALAFRRRRWWTQPPFLPMPDPTYMRWRMYTAYGDEHAVPPAAEIIAFARWRRETMGG